MSVLSQQVRYSCKLRTERHFCSLRDRIFLSFLGFIWLFIVVGHLFPTLHDRWRRKPLVWSWHLHVACPLIGQISCLFENIWDAGQTSCLSLCTVRMWTVKAVICPVCWVCWVSPWMCEQVSETALPSTLKDTVLSSTSSKNFFHVFGDVLNRLDKCYLYKRLKHLKLVSNIKKNNGELQKSEKGLYAFQRMVFSIVWTAFFISHYQYFFNMVPIYLEQWYLF